MKKTHPISLMRIALYIILAFSLAACRQSQQTPQGQPPITIDLQISPEPPAMGDSAFVITLADEAGQPIQSAQVEVRGDMTHAGMQPVSAVAEQGTGTDGEYRVPFYWTMGGDWIVTVNVKLVSGETYTKTFDFTVTN